MNNPKIRITVKDMGSMTAELYPEKAPITVANFLELVDNHFFEGLIFHRVIPGFMVQGGGFDTDFVQKPTNKPIKNEAANQLSNKRGTLAMARTQVVDSATCQFFINLVDNDFLDFKAPIQQYYGYCVFGKVTEGMDVVDKIAQVKTGSRGMHRDVPEENVVILEVTEE